MSALGWSTLSPEVKRRVRLAVLDVVRSAPPGQFWTAYGLQRHADLEDVEPEHQTRALCELVDRGVVHVSRANSLVPLPWCVGDEVKVWAVRPVRVDGVTALLAEPRSRATVHLVAKDGSCTVLADAGAVIPYRWEADGSCVEREGYFLRRIGS